MRFISLLLLTFTFIACSSSTPENLSKKIDQLIAEDDYQQAITLLEDADPAEVDADLSTLKEKTYLNYGLFLEYRGPESSSMRDRMTSALEQYIKVLGINADNQKARTEIKQIMSIYDTMPNRTPGEEIMTNLKELGFDF